MFFKTNRDENIDPKPNVRSRQRTKTTLVGEGIRLVGDLEGNGEIQILGVVEGERNLLTVGDRRRRVG